jgi:enoyl-CoA hydratase/carnithine racemase
LAALPTNAEVPLSFETLTVEKHGDHIEIVRMNRPEVLNALNTQQARDMTAYFEALSLEPMRLRCVILTGAGERAFCAGGDLKERRGMSVEAWNAQHLIFERMARALVNCPTPLIAAVNGLAYGGGCEIAAACDFIHASENARFALTEVTLGIIPGAGGTQTIMRSVGIRRTKELLMTGMPFTAAEARQWGLVNEVHPDASLMTATLAVAERIARNAPLAVRQVKQAISRGADMSLGDGMAFEIEAYNRLVTTEDRVEGVNAFNEKRPPVYRGR